MSQNFEPGDHVIYTGKSGQGVVQEWLGEDGLVLEDCLSVGPEYVTIRFFYPPSEGITDYTVRASNVEMFWEHNDRVYDDAVSELESSDYFCEDEDYVTITEEAHGLVYGDRNADYGHPYDDYVKNAAFLTTILGKKLKDDAEITPQDVILFMITLKVSRLINDHSKRDSIVDVAGYAECLMRVNRREAGLE